MIVKSGDFIQLEGRSRCLVLPDPQRKQRLRWLDRIYRPSDENVVDEGLPSDENPPATLTITNLPMECLTSYLGGSLVELLASKGSFLDIDLTPDSDQQSATCIVKYSDTTIPQSLLKQLKKGWRGYETSAEVVPT